MIPAAATPIQNGQALPLKKITPLPWTPWRDALCSSVAKGARLVALCSGDGQTLFAVLADDAAGKLGVLRTHLKKKTYPSLTPDCPGAHLFEREMAEQWGLIPEGHPWFKPVRGHLPWNGAPDPWKRAEADLIAGVVPFYRVEGAAIHEVGVGPVHAGVIEPGHFRFQCLGEEVYHLEIALGYQHRGIERALVGGPHPLTLKHMETAAGDTSIGHAWAYCQAVESFAGLGVPRADLLLRIVALELERLANHTGDLGALSGDTGFLPTASFCGRIRGDWLNLTAALCGNRLGRDLLRPGGCGFHPAPELCAEMKVRVEKAWADTRNAVSLLWHTPTVLQRFERVGPVSAEQARAIGLVGVAARASGLRQDTRIRHPSPGLGAPEGPFHFEESQELRGDVFSRAWVRWHEMGESVAFILGALDQLAGLPIPETPRRAAPLALKPNALCLSLVEGWRGEVAHLAATDGGGRFSFYKIVDPSFHNWTGLALALRGGQISDFPLCNKSFNLSYCGFDL